MIDWWSVVTNSLWIMGLASALAILSWADWLAAGEGGGLGDVVDYAVHSPGFALSIALIAVGASLSVATWWERIVWLLVAAGLATHAVRAWSRQRRDPNGGRSNVAN
jgi:hypothetical protein